MTTELTPSASPPAPLAEALRATLRSRIAEIDPDDPNAKDAAAYLWSSFAALSSALRECKAELESAIAEVIQAQGDIQISPTARLYLGTEKRYVCRDYVSLVTSIIAHAEGDLSRFAPGEGGLLSSDPWKHGALKQLLGPAEFDRHFTREVATDIKTGAAKAAKVLTANEWGTV